MCYGWVLGRSWGCTTPYYVVCSSWPRGEVTSEHLWASIWVDWADYVKTIFSTVVKSFSISIGRCKYCAEDEWLTLPACGQLTCVQTWSISRWNVWKQFLTLNEVMFNFMCCVCKSIELLKRKQRFVPWKLTCHSYLEQSGMIENFGGSKVYMSEELSTQLPLTFLT